MTDTEQDTTKQDKPQFDNVEDVEFTYATHVDPQRQADPHGIYLDDVQRVQAEIQRAKVEGRKPDLKNPPATVGTVLAPTSTLKSQYPGDFHVPVSKSLPVDLTVEETSSGTDLVEPVSNPVADESTPQTVSQIPTPKE